MGVNIPRRPLQTVADNLLVLPISFTVNGTTNPTVFSNTLHGVTRSSPGKWVLEVRRSIGVPYRCIYAVSGISSVADALDLIPKIDWSTVATDGLFTYRTLTGATHTDPADGTLCGGALFLQLDDLGPAVP